MTTHKEQNRDLDIQQLVQKGRQERSSVFFLAMRSILKERKKKMAPNSHQVSHPTSV